MRTIKANVSARADLRGCARVKRLTKRLTTTSLTMIRCLNTREKEGRGEYETYNMLDAVHVVSCKIRGEGERARVAPYSKHMAV